MPRSIPVLLCLVVLGITGRSTAAEPSFDAATRDPYRPAAAKSINGKSIAEMKAKVKSLWNGILFTKDGKPVNQIVILQTDVGDIEIEFCPDVAPGHVRSLIGLSQAGFYDGLIFHRCLPGFVIQGGCPAGDGTGGPGYCLKPEFNKKKHVRGVLSMARARPTDSAGSQFFICVDTAAHLDNAYTVFGKVRKGMDVVDKIVGADANAGGRPIKPVHIKKAKVTTGKADAGT